MNRGVTHRIATYNLFGEAGDLPDVVHCESIEARSLLHDWAFAAHRHARLHQLLYLATGAGTADLDGTVRNLPADTLVNVPMGCVHGYTFVPGTSGLVVTIASETLDAVLVDREGLRPVLERVEILRARAEIVATMRQLSDAFAGRGFGRAQILRSLAGLLLGQIAQALAVQAPPQDGSEGKPLFHRFEALVEAHFTDRWPVSAYARALAVSTSHLSRVTRAATGQPASRLIEERSLREARRNLVYTNLAVSTIAYALGFADPAYFSRVFSRATGLSPSAFRAQAARPA